MVINEGIEDVTDDFPDNWSTTTPGQVTSESGQGLVHSGDFSVRVSAGDTITVRPNDIPQGNNVFSYYRILTSSAPVGTTSATITFTVTGVGQQAIFFDDVSFAVQ